jgi:calreticulin
MAWFGWEHLPGNYHTSIQMLHFISFEVHWPNISLFNTLSFKFSMLWFWVLSVASTVYLEERFKGGWENRWSRPSVVRKGVQVGRVRVSAGDYYSDEKIQRGLETLEARRHYLLFSNFSHVFDTRDKDLIVQYTLRLGLYVDCSGHYLKLCTSETDRTRFSNASKYAIMFGPDICGALRRKTHVIIGHVNHSYPYRRGLTCYKDHLTHAYTLIIRKNNTIDVLVDGELRDSGTLSEKFNIPKVKVIPDPDDKKPDDWDDDPFVVDPTDLKPSDWVDTEFIPDPEATRPPAWDESIPWIAPMMKHPGYKGDWQPRTIPNPNYKGVWQPKMIEVEDPVEDPRFGHFADLSFLGLEFYQNTPGSILGNFLVTDDEAYAQTVLKEVLLNLRNGELRQFDALTDRKMRERDIHRERDQSIQKMRDEEKISAKV